MVCMKFPLITSKYFNSDHKMCTLIGAIMLTAVLNGRNCISNENNFPWGFMDNAA